MKVRDLITELKKHPEDMEVIFEGLGVTGEKMWDYYINLKKDTDLDKHEQDEALLTAKSEECLIIY